MSFIGVQHLVSFLKDLLILIPIAPSEPGLLPDLLDLVIQPFDLRLKILDLSAPAEQVGPLLLKVGKSFLCGVDLPGQFLQLLGHLLDPFPVFLLPLQLRVDLLDASELLRANLLCLLLMRSRQTVQFIVSFEPQDLPKDILPLSRAAPGELVRSPLKNKRGIDERLVVHPKDLGDPALGFRQR